MKTEPEQTFPIRIGISSCLLGEKVRFDAGHKRDQYIADVLGEYFEWVPVCPELEAGMGVPREAVRLVAGKEAVRMMGVKSGDDWTARMEKFSARRVGELRDLRLSGYIFKSRSPSCGIERVRVYSNEGMPVANGPGLFARAFMEAFPLIPIEEEGRLNDLPLRENFIERVFCYHRLQHHVVDNFSREGLIRFHAAHKYLLLAHSPRHYQLLGRVVAGMAKRKPSEVKEEYAALFMEGLSLKATVAKNVNVLQHIFGFFSDRLTPEEKSDVLAAIDDYHKKLVPLVVPLTLIRHFVKKLGAPYIEAQVYLNPHPKEMMLRNHV